MSAKRSSRQINQREDESMRREIARLAIGLFTIATVAMSSNAGASTTVVGFDGGDPGDFTGNAFFEAAGGNPGGAARHLGFLFFNELRTGGIGEPANAAFLGDFSSAASVTFSFDVKTNRLRDFIGNPIVRPVGIALKDRDIMGGNGPSGVFFEIGVLGEAFTPEWTTLSVTIDDPTSALLPPGWIGFGDEDPMTFEPILPAGATFATVLASVDEFAITGSVPGFIFTDADFDVQIDNVTVTVDGAVAVEASTWGALKAFYR
jgi:hypothetical protein